MEIYDQLVEEHITYVNKMDEEELKAYISKHFFGSMILEKLSLMLLQMNCIDVIQPHIEEYRLTDISWYKSFQGRAFNRCYDEFHHFECSIEQFQTEVISVLSQVKSERLGD